MNDNDNEIDMAMMTPPTLTAEETAKYLKGYRDRQERPFTVFQRPKGKTLGQFVRIVKPSK